MLSLNGNSISFKDTSFENINIDPLGAEVLIWIDAETFQGSQFTSDTFKITNLKDSKVLVEGTETSTLLWKMHLDSNTITKTDFENIEVTSGVKIESKT